MERSRAAQDIIDARFMARALQLANEGFYTTRPNPRVGCVIADGERVLGEGFHRRAGEAHAEINALNNAVDARGACAYVTLEPCCHQGRTPPCTAALIDAGVARVVYAVADPNPRVAGGGASLLRAAGIVVEGGVLDAPASTINRGFFSRMSHGKPWVCVKLGMSLDAKLALASGASQWITSTAARTDVQRLRASAGAVVTGSGTVLADDPRLTVRDERYGLSEQQPLRVILDSKLRVELSHQIFERPDETIIFTRSDNLERIARFRDSGVRVELCPGDARGLDLDRLLSRLGQMEINDVFVEAGPRLASAFVARELVDELIIFLAPKILGQSARDAFVMPAPAMLTDATHLKLVESRVIGDDIRLTYMRRSAVAVT